MGKKGFSLLTVLVFILVLVLPAVAVLLIGTPDESVDAVSGASTREPLETRTVIIK